MQILLNIKPTSIKKITYFKAHDSAIELELLLNCNCTDVRMYEDFGWLIDDVSSEVQYRVAYIVHLQLLAEHANRHSQISNCSEDDLYDAFANYLKHYDSYQEFVNDIVATGNSEILFKNGLRCEFYGDDNCFSYTDVNTIDNMLFNK